MAVLRQPDEVLALVFDVSGAAIVMSTVAAGTGVTNQFWQPIEVFGALYVSATKSLKAYTVSPYGSKVQVGGAWSTASKWVSSSPAATVVAAGVAPKGLDTVANYVANLYQMNEVFRGAFDPSNGALRIIKVTTGGGPVAGKKWQVDEVLNRVYDPVNNAIRVVKVSAGSGPTAVLRQPDEVLSAIFDPVAQALQEEGV